VESARCVIVFGWRSQRRCGLLQAKRLPFWVQLWALSRLSQEQVSLFARSSSREFGWMAGFAYVMWSPNTACKSVQTEAVTVL
jgi:hypothetical protein